MADNLQVILKGLLEEPVSSNSDNSATIKAKTFYKSCMKIEKIEEIHDTPLKELISNLGGWPVINENWQPVNWRKEELLARLRTELNQGIEKAIKLSFRFSREREREAALSCN